MNYGVIDLGTNTFHLLIANRGNDGQLNEIYRERIFVKLASDGIEKIGEAPYQRGLNAMIHYSKILKEHQISSVKAMGTAALRTASNGGDFVQEVLDKTGIQINLIPGAEEARLIHRGVAEAVPLDEKDILLMDIGGGSVEFIIANQEGIKWAESFPIGVAVLFQRFHQNAPITSTEIDAINGFLNQTLQSLFAALEKHPVNTIIGASGTFDVIELFLAKDQKFGTYSKVSTADFLPFYQRLLNSTNEERLAMEKLPNSRADLIVVAIVLIHFILEKANTQTILTSAYAMKEGILVEMME